MRCKGSSLLALLFLTAALTAGCGSAKAPSPANEQPALTKPEAPSSAKEQAALAKHAKSYGRAYEEESKNLPDVIETR